MKKIILFAGLGIMTTAGVTAAVLTNGSEKDKKVTKKKECVYKKSCGTKSSCVKKTVCY